MHLKLAVHLKTSCYSDEIQLNGAEVGAWASTRSGHLCALFINIRSLRKGNSGSVCEHVASLRFIFSF